MSTQPHCNCPAYLPTDKCDGTNKACTADAKQPATFECNPARDLCDAAETCDAVTNLCPTDVVRRDKGKVGWPTYGRRVGWVAVMAMVHTCRSEALLLHTTSSRLLRPLPPRRRASSAAATASIAAPSPPRS